MLKNKPKIKVDLAKDLNVPSLQSAEKTTDNTYITGTLVMMKRQDWETGEKAKERLRQVLKGLWIAARGQSITNVPATEINIFQDPQSMFWTTSTGRDGVQSYNRWNDWIQKDTQRMWYRMTKMKINPKKGNTNPSFSMNQIPRLITYTRRKEHAHRRQVVRETNFHIRRPYASAEYKQKIAGFMDKARRNPTYDSKSRYVKCFWNLQVTIVRVYVSQTHATR